MLTVTNQTFADTTILKCSGRIVRGEETALLCAAVQQQQRNLILDLAEVDAIDAAGIGLLVTLQAAGFYLTLMHASSHVRDVLSVTKLDTILEVLAPQLPQETVETVTANA